MGGLTEKIEAQMRAYSELAKEAIDKNCLNDTIIYSGMQAGLVKALEIIKKETEFNGNAKIEVDISEEDLQDLQNGEVFNWTFPNLKGEPEYIDIKLFYDERRD